MGAQALGHRLDSQSVFERAVEMGLTKQGEMFSASALCQLANDFHVKASLLEDVLSNNIQTVLVLLNQGKLLLVPYDNVNLKLVNYKILSLFLFLLQV